MAFMDKEHQSRLREMEKARLARAAALGSGSSGIVRENKRRNAAKKRLQHEANRKLAADMNAAADKSEGKNPRPYPGMRA